MSLSSGRRNIQRKFGEDSAKVFMARGKKSPKGQNIEMFSTVE